jgi:ribosomal-protein-alanine N-acetyltransferase
MCLSCTSSCKHNKGMLRTRTRGLSPRHTRHRWCRRTKPEYINPQPLSRMPSLVKSSVDDFNLARSWIMSQEECDLWSGGRVVFPVEQTQMLEAVNWNNSFNCSLVRASVVIGIGQLLKKENDRLHLARILISPEHRGFGFGRILVEKMVELGYANHSSCLSLNVSPQNKLAISLYESIGFRQTVRSIERSSQFFLDMEHSR